MEFVPFFIVVESNEPSCHNHQKCEHHVARMLAMSGGCLRPRFLLRLCLGGIGDSRFWYINIPQRRWVLSWVLHCSLAEGPRSSWEGPYSSATLCLPSTLPLLAAQILLNTIRTRQCSQTFGGNQKSPSGGKRWGPRQKHSIKSQLQTGVVVTQELPEGVLRHPPSSLGLQPGLPTEPCGCPPWDENAAFLLLLGWNKTLKS